MAKQSMKVGDIAAGIAVGAGLDKGILHILPKDLAEIALDYENQVEISLIIENFEATRDPKVINLVTKIRFLAQLSHNVQNIYN